MTEASTTLRLVIEAPDAVSLAHEVYLLYMQFVDQGVAPPLDPPTDLEESTAEEPAASKPPTTRKRAAKVEPTAEATAPQEESAATAEPEAEVVELKKAETAPGGKPTFADVEAVLKRLTNTKGFQTSVDTLAGLKVDRLKQLSEDRYQEAIDAFTAALDAKAAA